MKKKYYVVRKGRTTGIFNSWDECKNSVIGFNGAEYKGFVDYESAKAYLDNGTVNEIAMPDLSNLQDGEVVAYVDGSYNDKTNVFSFGAILFTKDGVKKVAKAYSDTELAAMRNVAGEITGAMYVMHHCETFGFKKLSLCYDYSGIENWCTGAWKANNTHIAAYKRFYNNISKKIDVTFVKVKGHSGNTYNDMADVLAKKVAGIL